MVHTQHVTFQYPGTEAISFPDIEVQAGEALLIKGESGCGKSTLLQLLAGLRRPLTGQIMIQDQDITKMSAAEIDQFRGKHIGIVHQMTYFIESLSIWDNLIVSPYASDHSRVKEVAQRLAISDHLKKYHNQLSVGQQQRAAIARSVMNDPKLILADEPTSALDNKNCSQVIELLLEEASRNQAALIIVTHDDRLSSAISKSIALPPLSSVSYAD